MACDDRAKPIDPQVFGFAQDLLRNVNGLEVRGESGECGCGAGG
jgi:hypothetical protein